MFSQRLPGDHAPNAWSAAIERRRVDACPLIDLTETNPTRADLQYDVDFIAGALAGPEPLVYEPMARGARRPRELIAALHGERGDPVDPDHIVLCASTSEAYGFLFKLLLDPGDEVLVPRPSYPLLGLLTDLEGVRAASYPLAKRARGGWGLDVDAVAHRWTPRTRAVVVVHPNNPTGNYLRAFELSALDALCAERGAALIVDEVFFDYRAPLAPPQIPSATGSGEALRFVLSGASKVLALPQLKLGWIIVGGPRRLGAEALRRLEFVADAYLSVGGRVQHSAPGLFRTRAGIQRQIRQRLDENERCLAQSVNDALRPREGGWSAVVDVPGHHSDESLVLELLEHDGILVHPGYFYDFVGEELIVLSLLPPPELFAAAVSRLAARLVRT